MAVRVWSLVVIDIYMRVGGKQWVEKLTVKRKWSVELDVVCVIG